MHALLPMPDIKGFAQHRAPQMRAGNLTGLIRFVAREKARRGTLDLSTAYADNVWVFRCVTARAKALASVPFLLQRGDTVIESHPVLDLLESRNNCGDASQFKLCTAGLSTLDGEAYWVSLGSDGFRATPQRLYVASNREIEQEIGEDEFGMDTVIGWTLIGHKGRRIDLPFDAVCPLQSFNPYNRFRGLSPLAPAGLSVQQDIGANRWNLSQLRNRAEPGGYLKSPTSLDDGQLEQLRVIWNDRHQGPDDAGRMAVLANLDWVQVAKNAKEMDWLGGKEVYPAEIAVAFDVPPIVAGILDDANRSTAQEQWVQFYLGPVLFDIGRILAKLNTWLLPRFPGTAGMAFVADLSKVPVLQHFTLQQIDKRTTWSSASSTVYWSCSIPAIPTAGGSTMASGPRPDQGMTNRWGRRWTPKNSKQRVKQSSALRVAADDRSPPNERIQGCS